MKTEMKVKKLPILAAALCGFSLMGALPALADNYSGKIDFVQVNSSNTRFVVSSRGLNLYANGAFRDLMIQGFYRRSGFTVTYTPVKCPTGIKGTCGNVSGLTVDTNNF